MLTKQIMKQMLSVSAVYFYFLVSTLKQNASTVWPAVVMTMDLDAASCGEIISVKDFNSANWRLGNHRNLIAVFKDLATSANAKFRAKVWVQCTPPVIFLYTLGAFTSLLGQDSIKLAGKQWVRGEIGFAKTLGSGIKLGLPWRHTNHRAID